MTIIPAKALPHCTMVFEDMILFFDSKFNDILFERLMSLILEEIISTLIEVPIQ